LIIFLDHLATPLPEKAYPRIVCFSAEFDIVAGAAITVVAIDTLRHNQSVRTLPLALIPAVFAAHTFMSAGIWLADGGVVSPAAGTASAWAFMWVAFVLLPVYIPISVLILEPPGWRRVTLWLLTGAGAISSADYFIGLLRGYGSATTMGWYIDYVIIGGIAFDGVFYLVATCGALLLSGHRPLFIWGVLNVVMVAVLALTVPLGVPSLWCLWAAATSVFVNWFIRTLPPQTASTPANSARSATSANPSAHTFPNS
jgi:hypothetical protein